VVYNELGEKDKARTYFERASDAGKTESMNNLGVLAARSGNTDLARQWFRRAADAGNAGAQQNLTLLDRRETDVPGLAGLSAREKAIVHHLVVDGMTFEEVAQEVAVASNVLRRHLARLQEHYARLHETGEIDAAYTRVSGRLST